MDEMSTGYKSLGGSAEMVPRAEELQLPEWDGLKARVFDGGLLFLQPVGVENSTSTSVRWLRGL